MSRIESPWSGRFEPLISDEEIVRRARVELPSLIDLRNMSVEQACAQLNGYFDKIYVPTEQGVSILRQLLQVAHAHCTMKYGSDLDFARHVHEQSAPLPNMFPPFCLSGLPGVGKSVLMDAFRRILPERSVIRNTACDTDFPLVASWSIQINANASPVAMLSALSGLAESAVGDLLKRARNRAYRDGVSFSIADEFQFASQSAGANANVTKLLLYLGLLGIPNIYIANFSLLRRLLRRPKEDRDRLLSRVLILRPVPKESDDWLALVRAYKSADPDMFVFNERRCADELHNLTAGISRTLARLLVLAYRNARNSKSKVDLNAIFNAYSSTEFTLARRDVEAIARQVISSKPTKGGEDFWCPIEGGNLIQTETRLDTSGTQVSSIYSALTRSEQQAVKSINKQLQINPCTEKVVPMKRQTKVTAEKLAEDTAWLLDGL